MVLYSIVFACLVVGQIGRKSRKWEVFVEPGASGFKQVLAIRPGVCLGRPIRKTLI
jgi:hypothetical protein